ncbi:hypothetical protein PIB30_081529 [Stylosanthes scabra]|uniref:Uncharacterized protein n=1 Tax=Stylosanthes scabra TaxID=79078 RepID=A0ABU6XTJ0_9FABA|nr:hypothetical protein [Stylosanthes scabra]
MVNCKSSATKHTQPKKDQGHDFGYIPKSIAVIFQNCLNNDPQKRALVDELGFGVFSNLPNYYLKQKVLKQIYNRFDTYDNTIYAVAGEVEITTEKIGKALGLNHTGSIYDEKITPRELSAEDYTAYNATSVDPILDGGNAMEENKTGENDESRSDKNSIDYVERQGKSKKKAKKTSSSSSESEYIDSSNDSESGSDETFSLPGSDSKQTMSDSMVRVERRTRSKKDSSSE